MRRVAQTITLPLLALVALIFAHVARAETVKPHMPEFAPGQMWSVKSVSPTTIKVIIGRIDAADKGKVAIHVSAIDVPIPKGVPGAGETMTIDHAPFEKSALATSVDKLLATDASPTPNFNTAYQQWLSAKGGIYTISVSKAVEMMCGSLMQRRG